MDLSGIPTKDLEALSAGDWANVSTETLEMISGESKGVQEGSVFNPRTIGQQAKREAGLTGRAIATGITGFPNLIGDAVISAANLAGADLPLPSRSLQGLLTKHGTPVPETSLERINQGIMSAMSGVGGMYGLGRALPQSMAGTKELLLTDPRYQIGGAVAGSAGADISREMGANPAASLGLGIIGSMAVPTGGVSANAVSRGVGAAVSPFSKAGREKIVGDVLLKHSTNADDALMRMSAYPSFVKGVRPTTAAVTGDPGLIGLQRFAKSIDPADTLGMQQSENNALLNELFARYSLGSERIGQMKDRRNEITSALRESAFAAGNAKSVDPLPIVRKLDLMASSASGQRKPARDAAAFARSEMERLGDNIESPEYLYAARQNIAEAIAGKYDGEMPQLRLARKQLGEILQTIDGQIESAAPGYSKYMDRFRKLSRGINQMEEVAKFDKSGGGGIFVSAPDIRTGYDFFSQPFFRRAIENNMPLLRKTLSKKQIGDLNSIGAELDRAAVLNQANVRVAGSDTFKNATTAFVIGRMFGAGVAQNETAQKLLKPIAWMQALTADEMNGLLLAAVRDPKIASRLMMKASVLTIDPLGKELKRKAVASGIGQGISMADD
jgi:hypothetical protein